jgi:hypothetical protein
MSLSELSSTANGDGKIYYQPIHGDGVPQGQREVIVVIKHINDDEIADQFRPAPTLKLGIFKTAVHLERIQCQERKFLVLKSEYYNDLNELKYLSVPDPFAERSWVEFTDRSTPAVLQRVLCGPREVQK